MHRVSEPVTVSPLPAARKLRKLPRMAKAKPSALVLRDRRVIYCGDNVD